LAKKKYQVNLLINFRAANYTWQTKDTRTIIGTSNKHNAERYLGNPHDGCFCSG